MPLAIFAIVFLVVGAISIASKFSNPDIPYSQFVITLQLPAQDIARGVITF